MVESLCSSGDDDSRRSSRMEEEVEFLELRARIEGFSAVLLQVGSEWNQCYVMCVDVAKQCMVPQ